VRKGKFYRFFAAEVCGRENSIDFLLPKCAGEKNTPIFCCRSLRKKKIPLFFAAEVCGRENSMEFEDNYF